MISHRRPHPTSPHTLALISLVSLSFSHTVYKLILAHYFIVTNVFAQCYFFNKNVRYASLCKKFKCGYINCQRSVIDAKALEILPRHRYDLNKYSGLHLSLSIHRLPSAYNLNLSTKNILLILLIPWINLIVQILSRYLSHWRWSVTKSSHFKVYLHLGKL